MMNTRPLILVTNDDGYDALGLRTLIEYVSPLGDVVCVCPASQHSGQSMAMTITAPLTITEREPLAGARTYAVNGTPVDCVKVSMHHVLRRRPDLVLAGINHGSNASVNVLYSGTMGAVMEGSEAGVPSVGFSLTDHDPRADFSAARPFVESITRKVLAEGLPDRVCLNVNIPAGCRPAEMRVVRDCRGRWADCYREYRTPWGTPFYWLEGEFVNLEPEATDTDQWCLDHGIVSIVPVLLDRTAPLSLLGNRFA